MYYYTGIDTLEMTQYASTVNEKFVHDLVILFLLSYFNRASCSKSMMKPN